MRIGIEKIRLYAGRCRLEMADLASARGVDPEYVRGTLMCQSRSVFPICEDAVTMAVNAAQRLLSPPELADVALLLVATESSVDFGKPVSSWVHRFCNLPANCRSLEVKHACYAGTGALMMAASWLASGLGAGKKALVINADCSRPCLGVPWEMIAGGGAVAMLISEAPRVLELDWGRSGYWTDEVHDTFRPSDGVEIMKDQVSVYSYLDALEGACDHYEAQAGRIDPSESFDRHIYHAPFPGMTLIAHRALMRRSGEQSEACVSSSFRRKVADGLYYHARMGSCYGSSNFVSLMGALARAGEPPDCETIGLFAYGSGCQGEFYSATVPAGARAIVKDLDVDRSLAQRARLTVPEYESVERQRAHHIGARDLAPDVLLRSACRRLYDDTGLLTLSGIEDYHRSYDWS